MNSNNNASAVLFPAMSSMSSICISCCLIMCVFVLLAKGTIAPLNGPMVSAWYGGQEGGNPFAGQCGPGSWIATTTVYTKKNDTVDGFYAECADKTGKISKLIAEGDRHGDGIAGQSEGKNKSKVVASIVNWGKWVAVAAVGVLMTIFTVGWAAPLAVGMVTTVGAVAVPPMRSGREAYMKGGLVALDGFNKVNVWTRETSKGQEVSALQFVSTKGQTTAQPIGGTKDKDGERPKYTYACPYGTVMTGVRGRAGERLNGIQFACKKP